MKFKTYKIRWLLLVEVWLIAAGRQFVSTSFAISNDIVAHFFFVTPYQVDLLAIADTILAVFVCLVLSIVGKNVGVRAQCILAASVIALGNLLSSISFLDR